MEGFLDFKICNSVWQANVPVTPTFLYTLGTKIFIQIILSFHIIVKDVYRIVTNFTMSRSDNTLLMYNVSHLDTAVVTTPNSLLLCSTFRIDNDQRQLFPFVSSIVVRFLFTFLLHKQFTIDETKGSNSLRQ